MVVLVRLASSIFPAGTREGLTSAARRGRSSEANGAPSGPGGTADSPGPPAGGPRAPPTPSCTLPQSGEFPMYGTTRLPAQRSGSLLSSCLAWRKDCRCHSAVWLVLGRRAPSPCLLLLAWVRDASWLGHRARIWACVCRPRLGCPADHAFRQQLRP